jgi:plastocyanin
MLETPGQGDARHHRRSELVARLTTAGCSSADSSATERLNGDGDDAECNLQPVRHHDRGGRLGDMAVLGGTAQRDVSGHSPSRRQRSRARSRHIGVAHIRPRRHLQLFMHTPLGNDRTGHRSVRSQFAVGAAAVGALAALAGLGEPARAQSLLDRPPNLSGNWVGSPGTVYFNFIHRFTASDAPERKVSNFPTFLVAAGLPYRLLVGFNYATNSNLAPQYPNEWEFFARHHLLRQDDGAPLDFGGQVAYNLAAEGVDGEVSAGRRIGRLRVIGAARVLSNPFVSGETRFAFAGGGTLRVARYLALAGDVAHVMNDDAPNSRPAWSAGLHLAIPYTPHTLSLQATNTNVGTLQGTSRGGDVVRYGFEFTVPLTLRRWFGTPATPPEVAGPTQRVDTVVVVQRDSVSAVTPRAPAARADSLRADTPRAAPTPADTARPAAAAAGRTPPRRTPAARPTVVNVVLRNTTFVPGRIQITAGTTVVWRNEDQLIHSVTATDKSFDSGLLQPGKTYRHTFDKPGQYSYYCMPHPFMKGVVVVR